jgi:hypothetical protein
MAMKNDAKEMRQAMHVAQVHADLAALAEHQ